MSIRVYELSKIIGVSSKDLLSVLREKGFDVSSPISVVPPEAVELVNKEFTKSSKSLEKEEIKKADSKDLQKKGYDQNGAKKAIEEEQSNTKSSLNQVKLAPNEIYLTSMTLAEIAQRIQKPVNDIILTLLRQGIVISKNQILDESLVKKLADLYGLKVVKKELEKEVISSTITQVEQKGQWIERLPIVVVVGHVDHGKTTLLDFIRKTRVAAKEKGGITQHLGAYEVKTAQGALVFLDTPGHEAFATLRMRGIKAADIAVLVVAADDGVMPQTVEAIKYAKSVGLPIIVAINKIDKSSPERIEFVNQQLAQYDLIPEKWGGSTVVVPISAKLGQGIDDLLDVIILQSQLMELRSNISVPAYGYILESKLEKGRGPVATVICQHGKLKVGDYFVAGSTIGKVNTLIDSYGKKINEANPSIPVMVSGFSSLPQTGDIFQVIDIQEYKKLSLKKKPLDSFVSITGKKAKDEGIKIIIKTDNISSKEALVNSINKLSEKVYKGFNIVFAGVGDIIESDVLLASQTKSIIYGFHVKTTPKALDAITQNEVVVKHFDIIYKLLEDLEQLSEKLKPVKMVFKKVGEAVVIQIFNIKNVGVVAGARVKSGRFVKDGKVVVYRYNKKVGEGYIKNLQREHRAVKEVYTGFECAFFIENFQDWQIGDNVECYQELLQE